MRSPIVASLLFCAFLSPLPLLAAEDAQPPVDRLKAAADLTALDVSGLRPWHWKLDLSLFDREGKNPKPGSLEMWFSDGNLRTVASLGAKQITTLRVGDQLYQTAGDEKEFYPIRLIEMQVLHPIPDGVVQPSIPVKTVQESVASIKLECMIPAPAPQSTQAFPGVEPISFCFEQGGPKMLITHEPGNLSVLRPRVGMFQSHQVPVDLQMFSGTVLIAEAKTAKLSTEPADPALFKADPAMSPVSAPVQLTGVDLRGLVLSRNPPVYPPDAKQKHLAGAVTLSVTIGKDGHLSSLEPMPKSNDALVGSARDAVNNWVFRPYVISGLPVEVKTQITVLYRPAGAPATDDAPPEDINARRSSH